MVTQPKEEDRSTLVHKIWWERDTFVVSF
jgi:hypothetical protein